MLGRKHQEITAVYLFGSSATGKVGPLSDVDVAVLLQEKSIAPKKQFGFLLDLLGEAMHACRRPDVEVVLLNQASPLLAYEIVRHGKVLYERHPGQRVATEARIVRDYLDFEPFHRVQRRYLKDQLVRRIPHGQS